MKLKAEQIFEKNTKITGNKTNALANLLIKYLEHANKNDIMPNKKDVSELLGISVGTVQNAYRILEDKGLVQSKQRVGTVITSEIFQKQNSKRDYCINLIKKYMTKNNIKDLKDLPSARTVSKAIGIPLNTVASSINCLKIDLNKGCDKNITLAQIITEKIEQYIEKECKIGSNILAMPQLAKKYNVSIKTIHDAIKNLQNRKILSSHRGRYGTVVLNMPNNPIIKRKEDLIFAPSKETAFYFYEKIQNFVKKLIKENFDIGMQIPTVRELAEKLNTNTSTIRRALKYLEEEGYITCVRGRYGGTFVTSIPEDESYKWLAINPKYVEVYN